MATLKSVGGDNPIVCPLIADSIGIGRDPANAIPLADKQASSRHARIVRDGAGWRIEDLGSRNGTFVNGAKVTSVLLKHGDEIRIGTTELILEHAAVPVAEVPMAPTEMALDEDAASDLLIDDAEDAATESEIFTTAPVHGEPFALGLPSPTLEDQDARRRAAAPKDLPEGAVPTPHHAEAKLRLIQQVSEKLVRVLDSKRLIDEIMSIVISQTKADRGFICLLDDNRQPIPIASHGLAPGEQMRVSRTVLRRLLDERTGVLIPQVAAGGDVMTSLQMMQVSSTLCAPLWIGDDIIGFMSLDSTTPGRSFTPEELDLLMGIAHQAAVGIERSRLVEKNEKETKVRAYLSQYLDDKIVERITSGGGADLLAPAERVVTVLFTDIVSFTKISEGLAPAELAAFVRSYLTKMTDIIFAHGGTIDKYIGDAIMALFGAPMELPNSATAAVRAALAMRESARAMKPPSSKVKTLRVRYGVNTGHLVVGNIGSERRVEYTAIGDAVNVASRIQTFARPNEICIDENTYAATGNAFDVEEIGSIDVKNRDQPVVIYKVLGAK